MKSVGQNSAWWMCGALALFAAGPIARSALASRPTYHYAIERFRIEGSATGVFVDEFDDGNLAPNWSIGGGAVDEADGVVHLRSPGTPIPGVPAIEVTGITFSQLVHEGAGGFHASVTFKHASIAPGEVLFLQLASGGGAQTFGVGNLGSSYMFVQADVGPGVPNDIRTLPTPTSALVGDLVVRIEFDEITNLVSSSFSLDGGVQFRSPFGPIKAFTRATSGQLNMGVVAVAPDSDGDGIADDGDFSGQVGDHPCSGGVVVNCDDNCPSVANPDQRDTDADGVGDACDTLPPPTCGNGRLDPGEQCDAGTANGGQGSCCGRRCTPLQAGSVCRRAAHPCDSPEVCSGVSPICPDDAISADAAPCDDGSTCTGADRCGDGVCREGTQCAGISILDASTVGPRASLRISVRLRDTSGSGAASVQAVGLVDTEDDAAVLVTRRVRRPLTARNRFQAKIVLRPNAAGRQALDEAGSDGILVRVEVAVTDRNGLVTTLAETTRLTSTAKRRLGKGTAKGDGIRLIAKRRGADLVTIRWQVSRAVIQARPSLYEFQLWLDEYGEWNPFLGTRAPSDRGKPVVARLPFSNRTFCLRMVAYRDDSIIASGTSGNEGPCLR